MLIPVGLFAEHENIFFTPNAGQWNKKIDYSLQLRFGWMYVEETGLTFLFAGNQPDEHGHSGTNERNAPMHCLRVNFPGANTPVYEQGKPTSFHYNYFIGNDPSRWKSDVYSTYRVTQKNIYNGVDLAYYGNENEQIEYDYIVHPGASPAVIRREYLGAEELKIVHGDLYIKTSLGTVIEKAPAAYQVVNGEKKNVKCKFKIDGNEVVFLFPSGYEEQYELIIDPVLIFASYSGSTANNFGFTATYDSQKNTYGAGIVYSGGQYPVTPGAFQSGFNGANISTRDAAISKYNVGGNNLLFSTYLGGTGTDGPHSMVVNASDELFVMGTTGSTDFPMVNAFDNTFNGGATINIASNGMDYVNGVDIYVAHFAANGSSLIGSTYIGGTSNDGLNNSTNLYYNYGDAFRGEIIIDNAGNCIVASATSSTNFPVTGNAIQPGYGGGSTDGVIFKLNAGLSSLLWSTYFGGSAGDALSGVQLGSNGDIYAAGGTESSGLITTPGAIGPAFNGGTADGIVLHFSATGSALLGSTYLGTAAYDQCYFVQLDDNDDVYVVGQTTGAYPVTPSTVYNNPNSGQFIHKMNNTFTTTGFSTTVGRGMPGIVDISPSAFLVNHCGHIYLSGWGGIVNHYAQALSSTTVGLPLTGSPFQSTTDGSDFYLMILSQDAGQLLYGTFVGGPLSDEHVDGGTSRFDKDGVVYQAVCAGCQNNSDFPVTPGVWSLTNNSTGCNLAVFKFDLQQIIAQASFSFVGDPCAVPADVLFDNTSIGAISYFWDFGDGTTSTAFEPAHTYTNPGSYQILLVGMDSLTCQNADTAILNIFIPGPLTATISPADTICIGDSTVLNAGGGATYQWIPSTGISGGNTSSPTVFPNQSTVYSVIVTDTSGCIDTQSVYIHVMPMITADMTIQFDPCVVPVNISFLNNSTNGVSYFWDFGNGLTSTQPDDQSLFTSPGDYSVMLIATDSSTCNISDTAYYDFQVFAPPTLSVTGTDTICSNQTGQLFVSGAESYTWFPSIGMDDPNSSSPLVGPDATITYGVIGIDTNGCADTAFISVDVFPAAYIDAGPDLIVDIGDTPILNPTVPGSGGTFYWVPGTGLSCDSCLNPVATPDENTWYYLHYTDIYGCNYIDSMYIIVSPSVFIPNAFTPNGDDHNNIFQPVVRNLQTYEFWIFDRWGQIVFHSTNPAEGWNGTHNNVMCPIDVYVWKIRYSDYIEPDIYREKYGHVTLIK